MTTHDEFLDLVRARLAQGAKTYGLAELKSGDPRSLEDFRHNIIEELADVCAWSALASARIDEIFDWMKAQDALFNALRGGSRQ